MRRKTPCIINISTNENNIKNIEIPPFLVEFTQNTTILPQNTTILPQNTTILENKLNCKYCNKKYSRKDSLNRHILTYCKEKKNIISY
jgi:uncharacterized Zn-finger protein